MASALMNALGSKKPGNQPFTPADFCVWVRPEPEEATLEEAFMIFKALAGANGG